MRRILELDLLRFFAVLLVMGRHMTFCSSTENRWAASVSEIWQRGGWIGVDLFFVLSGFLVSGLLFQEHQKTGSVDIKRFLIRRGFKIYPPFWALLVFTILFQFAISAQLDFGKIFSELLFVQNYFPALWNHTWSLAVEEHFYILLSLVVFSLAAWMKQTSTRLSFQAIPRIFCGVAIACLVMRGINGFYVPEAGIKQHLMLTHLRIDSLFFGVCLAYFWHTSQWLRFKLAWQKWGMIGLGALLFLPAFLFPVESTWWIPVFGVVLFFIGSGLILIGMLNLKLPDRQPLLALGKIGTYSYSIYLWHMPMQVWLTPILLRLLPEPFANSWWSYLTIYVGGSFVLGIGMAKLIEMPTLMLREKLYPKTGKSQSSNQSESVPVTIS